MEKDVNLFGIVREDEIVQADPVIAKEEEYKQYLDNHIKNVIRAYNDLIQNDWINNSHNIEIKQALKALREDIINHDASKYSDDEFYPFRAYLYPVSDQEKEDNKEAFEEAKKKHYKRNDHHPEYWIREDGTIQDMTMKAILHLICDWEAMACNGNPIVEFWNNTKDTRWVNSMSKYTFDTVNRLINLLHYKE